MLRNIKFIVTVKHYLWSILFANRYLVLYTYLHHLDRNIKYYDDNKWSFQLGALQTIDRPHTYGKIINYLHHHIGDTHVCHHIFSYVQVAK